MLISCDLQSNDYDMNRNVYVVYVGMEIGNTK